MRFNNLLIGVLLLAGSIPAQSVRTYAPETAEPTARRIPAIFEMTGTLPPHWSGQALIGVEDNQSNGPLIYLIDRDGGRDHFSFAIPDAGIIYVHGLAMSPDGTVAIVGGAVSGDSRAASFVALVPPGRKGQTVVRTWPYVPWAVAFVPDGSLWTVGNTFHDTADRLVKVNIMSHFDSAGKLLGSFPVKSRLGPGREVTQNSLLRASSDRIGWFTSGMEYIEFSFDGRELGRYEGPETRAAMIWASLALSGDNEVLFGTIQDAKRATWTLDRETHRWIPVQFQDTSLSAWGHLLGFDGGTLVTTAGLHEMRRYKGAGKTTTQ
jgi:hypothetical protein